MSKALRRYGKYEIGKALIFAVIYVIATAVACALNFYWGEPVDWYTLLAGCLVGLFTSVTATVVLVLCGGRFMGA